MEKKEIHWRLHFTTPDIPDLLFVSLLSLQPSCRSPGLWENITAEQGWKMKITKMPDSHQSAYVLGTTLIVLTFLPGIFCMQPGHIQGQGARDVPGGALGTAAEPGVQSTVQKKKEATVWLDDFVESARQRETELNVARKRADLLALACLVLFVALAPWMTIEATTIPDATGVANDGDGVCAQDADPGKDAKYKSLHQSNSYRNRKWRSVPPRGHDVVLTDAEPGLL